MGTDDPTGLQGEGQPPSEGISPDRYGWSASLAVPRHVRMVGSVGGPRTNTAHEADAQSDGSEIQVSFVDQAGRIVPPEDLMAGFEGWASSPATER